MCVSILNNNQIIFRSERPGPYDHDVSEQQKEICNQCYFKYLKIKGLLDPKKGAFELPILE